MKRLRLTCIAILGSLSLFASGCDDRRMGMRDGNLGVCAYDLAAVPAQKAVAVAQAETQAKVWCTAASRAAVSQCPGGGVSVVGQGDANGEAWWFDAKGQLVAYEFWAPDGTCGDKRYGDAPDCPSGPADFNLCAVEADAADATLDAALAQDPDSSAPDALDIAADVSAADIPVDNTTCASQADCAADKWCNVSGCGFQLGLCLAKPVDCSGQFGPVCGCDGKSYDSACHAQKAGKSIAAYSAPCLGTGCAPTCASGYTCVDCASAGVQCLQPGKPCVGGK